jgi:maleylacetate reductase
VPDFGTGFTWLDGERLIRFGAGALDDAPSLLAARGFEDFALLTTERALAGAPSLGELASVTLHVPEGPVPDAAGAVRANVGARPLVVVGGGRVIDSGKAIAGADGLRCAAIPTTLSGAEMTPFHRMPVGVDEFTFVRPALVIAAPELMASQPLPALAASAMNALAHAIEALYAPMANPVAELAALRAADLLARGLVADEPSRDDLALGALLAGYASGSAGFSIHHAVCQTIVRVAGTPHAQTNAVMLPRFVRFMEKRVPDEIAKLAAAIGAGETPDSAARRITELSRRAGATKLSELGVERAALEKIVSAAMSRPELKLVPSPPAERELLELLERSL